MIERHYTYLIVGGGMTADAAVRGIRQIDSDRSIGIIGEELDPPYNRPPLSKGLWKNGPRAMTVSRIFRGTEKLGVDLHLGRKAVHLEPAMKRLADDQGNTYLYDRLLLATGGEPIRLGADHKRVIYFRTLADYHRLRKLAEIGQRFAVIGGGFIGSEIAAALSGLGKEVMMIFPENGIGARVLPREFCDFLNTTFLERGVRLLDGQMVNNIQPDEDGVSLRTSTGGMIHVDGVVAGLGIRPNTGLAQSAGITTSDGIEVDAFMRTNIMDIFAAGDVANIPDPVLGKRMRFEHEENANLSGVIAGVNMAGEQKTYETTPAVYSTLF